MRPRCSYRSSALALSLSAFFSISSFYTVSARAQDSAAAAPVPVTRAPEKIDLDMMAKIRDEGLNRSQVMPTLLYLSEVIGPRLTGSAQLKHANEWTKSKLTEWGLQNAHLEAWGPFGRGWEIERFSAQVVEPMTIPLIALPKAWSPSVKGTLKSEVVYLDATDEAGLEKYKGQLKGKIVLLSPPRAIAAHFEPQGTRYTDAQLAEMAVPPDMSADRPRRGRPGGAMFQALQMARRKLWFCQEEGAALTLEISRGGDGGTVFVQQITVPSAAPITPPGPPPGTPAGSPPPPPGAPPASGSTPPAAAPATPPPVRPISPWSKDAPKGIVPQVVVSSEHYNRLVRLVQAGEKVEVEVELKTKFYDNDDGMVFNTVAEIPGTDKKDEVVMCGGHMDSWHGATGATDNGAGVAVCMEAVRILEALKVQPRRTVRIALWSGEEEGLFGSRNYVAQHFGERKDGKIIIKPEQEKVAAYFNLDNGTGKVRGVYCQGNSEVAPIFAEWLKPFNDLGATTITLRNTGGTDHLSFDAVGIPGFQFIQDEIEYEARTHHSNQDNFDRIQGDDLKQASTIMAAFLYDAAMRDDKLPRKPLP
jgi:hypothetical protein